MKMSSTAALNRPQRCLQELHEFDCSMGWTFHDFSTHEHEHAEDEYDLLRREYKRREHTHTAFDERVEVPSEFVAPVQTKTKSSCHPKSTHHKQKPSNPQSESSHRRVAASSTVDSSIEPKKPAAARRHKPSESRRKGHKQVEEPVDFVYDVDVRRRLREKMDTERAETRKKATLREQKLRSENMWVRNEPKGQLPSSSARRQAWQSTESEKSRAPSQKTLAGKVLKGPNVSEWRVQTSASALHPSAEGDRFACDLQYRTRQHEQRHEAHEVSRSLDAFEHKMKQWAI